MEDICQLKKTIPHATETFISCKQPQQGKNMAKFHSGFDDDKTQLGLWWHGATRLEKGLFCIPKGYHEV